MKNNFLFDHTLIIDELEKSIKVHNWDSVLPFLPTGSYLVGGYIRDIILGRVTDDVDIDIVVPFNAIEIGKYISDKIKSKFIVLDKKREVIRIILTTSLFLSKIINLDLILSEIFFATSSAFKGTTISTSTFSMTLPKIISLI